VRSALSGSEDTRIYGNVPPPGAQLSVAPTGKDRHVTDVWTSCSSPRSRRFTAVLTRALQISIFRSSSIQSTPPHSKSPLSFSFPSMSRSTSGLFPFAHSPTRLSRFRVRELFKHFIVLLAYSPGQEISCFPNVHYRIPKSPQVNSVSNHVNLVHFFALFLIIILILSSLISFNHSRVLTSPCMLQLP
jgi:hypothetical protein